MDLLELYYLNPTGIWTSDDVEHPLVPRGPSDIGESGLPRVFGPGEEVPILGRSKCELLPSSSVDPRDKSRPDSLRSHVLDRGFTIQDKVLATEGFPAPYVGKNRISYGRQ